MPYVRADTIDALIKSSYVNDQKLCNLFKLKRECRNRPGCDRNLHNLFRLFSLFRHISSGKKYTRDFTPKVAISGVEKQPLLCFERKARRSFYSSNTEFVSFCASYWFSCFMITKKFVFEHNGKFTLFFFSVLMSIFERLINGIWGLF